MSRIVEGCCFLRLCLSLYPGQKRLSRIYMYLWQWFKIIDQTNLDWYCLVLCIPPNINQDKFTHSIVSYSMFSMKFLGRYKVVPVLSWIEFRYNC